MLDPWDKATYHGLDFADIDRVPLDDTEASAAYATRYPWAFDKIVQLRIFGAYHDCNMEHGLALPAGRFPCIAKPRQSAEDLAAGLRLDPETLRKGELWQRRYTGEHFSLDVPVLNGHYVMHVYPALGIEDVNHPGRFLAWQVAPRFQPCGIADLLRPFRRLLRDYRGFVNFEFRRVSPIDRRLRLIELHLRPSVEFFPIYGEAAVRSIFRFYAGRRDDTSPGRSGAAIIEPHGASTITLTSDCDEHSWRRRIHYTTPSGIYA